MISRRPEGDTSGFGMRHWGPAHPTVPARPGAARAGRRAPQPHPHLIAHEFGILAPNGRFPADTMDGSVGWRRPVLLAAARGCTDARRRLLRARGGAVG